MVNLLTEWEKARRVFPVIYQESMLNTDARTRPAKFAIRLARRLRFAGFPSHAEQNMVVVEHLTIIWITQKNVAEEKSRLDTLLQQQGLFVGYVVKVAESPVWDMVLSQAVNQEHQELRSDVKLT